jgi:hypothetical protein
MKFVKLENGNVNITDDSGLIEYTFTDNAVRINPIGLNETVQISQYGYPILTFIIADVSGTQILPAAEIAFAGTTASDLIDILSAGFFLIDSGGISGGATELTSIDVLNSLNNNSIIASLLQKIIDEQKITNKLLNKIYQ